MYTYNSGSMLVGPSGKIQATYLFDGGWFRGELGVFSLKGMKSLTPGSTKFMLEAAKRILSDSKQGHILIQDNLEGARFSADLGYERDFNTDATNHRGAKSFSMTAGDEVGLMLIQHNTVKNTFDKPGDILQFGKLPLFSIPEANFTPGLPGKSEFVDVNGTGLVAMEDMPIRQADRDYNDLVLKLQGLKTNLASYKESVNPVRDWRSTDVGKKILSYPNPPVFDEGVFEVGKSGEVKLDFLYDGGMYQGEVGIFSLEGMDAGEISSKAFIEEAINRVQSDTTKGHIVVQDPQEGAKFHALLDWEKDFNHGEYQGPEIFQMKPGELFGLVLVPNGTFSESLTADKSIVTKDPIFSMSQANYNDRVQFSSIKTATAGTIVSFEDDRLDRPANKDYNDIILAMEGVGEPVGVSAIEDVIFSGRNWLDLPLATDNILPYFDNSDLHS